MTTRERILTLSDGGHEPHMIAALLDLTVTDVVETLADPEHEPAEIGGGGGESGSIVLKSEDKSVSRTLRINNDGELVLA